MSSRSASLRQYWDAVGKWASKMGTNKAQARSNPVFKETYQKFRAMSNEAKKHYKEDDKAKWSAFAQEYRETLQDLDIYERDDIDWGSE